MLNELQVLDRMHIPTNLITGNNFSSILLAFFFLSLLFLFHLFFLILILPMFLSLPADECQSQKQQHCHTETCPYQGRVGSKVVHAQVHQVITTEIIIEIGYWLLVTTPKPMVLV
jgi:hypothetical protein